MTATKQWNKMLNDLLRDGESASPRDQSTIELLNYHSQINMRYPVLVCPERKLSYQFMCAEAYWIMSGDNRVETIQSYAPSIAKFSDDGVTFFGAYGPRIGDQLESVVDKLAKDHDTRQAVLTIWRPNPPPTKDVPCTVAIQWIIRGGRLHCIDTMRSSDMWLGWPYDVFNFTMVSVAVLQALSLRGVNLELGSLFLNAGSQHLYRRNLENAQRCRTFGEIPALEWTQFGSFGGLMEFLKQYSNGESSPRKISWLSSL